MTAAHSTDVTPWPGWLKSGTRIWLGARDARIELIDFDLSVVFRRTRRAGFVRFRYTPAEVRSLLERDLLREYVKRPRRPRSPTSKTPLL